MGLGFLGVRLHEFWNLWCLRFRGLRICRLRDLGGLKRFSDAVRQFFDA